MVGRVDFLTGEADLGAWDGALRAGEAVLLTGEADLGVPGVALAADTGEEAAPADLVVEGEVREGEEERAEEGDARVRGEAERAEGGEGREEGEEGFREEEASLVEGEEVAGDAGALTLVRGRDRERRGGLCLEALGPTDGDMAYVLAVREALLLAAATRAAAAARAAETASEMGAGARFLRIEDESEDRPLAVRLPA